MTRATSQIINHLVQVALGFIYRYEQKFRLSQEKEGIMDRVEKHFSLQLWATKYHNKQIEDPGGSMS